MCVDPPKAFGFRTDLQDVPIRGDRRERTSSATNELSRPGRFDEPRGGGRRSAMAGGAEG